MRAQPRRQLLLDTACKLFNENGYNATGIDLILATSGVSKATLYKHFRSKDELILAVLVQRHEEVFGAMQAAFESAKQEGMEHPALKLFDLLDGLVNSKDFFGCNFINACSEFTDSSHEIHKYAARHKDKVKQLLLDYLVADDEKAKLQQAEAISLLMDGAIVNAQVIGNLDSAKTAKKVAEQILNS